MSDKVHINKVLLPISLLYGIAVWIRNKFFDWDIFPSTKFNLPVISVGNIAVGGTGKTPHTEYLIRLLQDDYKVAVLSRGYKRESSGFILAGAHVTSRDIGDEPYQIWKKFPNIIVAVDKRRVRGIQHLLALPEEKRPNIILLDDAYQHRHVTPSLSILLTEYKRLLTNDCLLPAGRLRESAKNRFRAQMLIVTKCPEDVKPLDRRIIIKNLGLYPYQSLFFSSLKYGQLLPVFNDNRSAEIALEEVEKQQIAVLLLAGIAHPELLIDKLSKYAKNMKKKIYPDHHAFSKKELLEIGETYRLMDGDRKIIVTTEKDAARLADDANVPESLKSALYYLPVEVTFHDEDLFKQKIITHVRTIKRNRFLD